jgi:hypothetical protein
LLFKELNPNCPRDPQKTLSFGLEQPGQ